MIVRPSASPRARSVLRRHIQRAGVKRTVQPRATQTRDALLASGRQLLNQGDFDSLPVAELAAANGLSVGSFYGRFRDKASYFALLQELVTSEWLESARQRLSPAVLAPLDARATVAAICASVVDQFRRDRGFIQSALKQASTRPASWTPVRRTGVAFSALADALLAPHLPQLAPETRRARVGFAMQVLYGTLVNAVLNDPGPLRLADASLADELSRMLTLYLGLDTPS